MDDFAIEVVPLGIAIYQKENKCLQCGSTMHMSLKLRNLKTGGYTHIYYCNYCKTTHKEFTLENGLDILEQITQQELLTINAKRKEDENAVTSPTKS